MGLILQTWSPDPEKGFLLEDNDVLVVFKYLQPHSSSAVDYYFFWSSVLLVEEFKTFAETRMLGMEPTKT